MKQTLVLAAVNLLFLGVPGGDSTLTKPVNAESLSPPLGLKSITGHEENTFPRVSP
jgi:hypothetical protein